MMISSVEYFFYLSIKESAPLLELEKEQALKIELPLSSINDAT